MTRTPPPTRTTPKRALAWRAMDLHLHTPASSDYQEPRATYLDLLLTAEARGLDLIAFADHNTVSGYRRLKDEIEELELLERLQRLQPEEKKRLEEYRRLLSKILVLPGFEFTATFGFHILGLFPPDTPVRDLEHLLLLLNIPSEQLDKGSATVGATADVLTAYQQISAAGGLVVAAHANSTNGVAMRGFNFGGQTKIAYTQDEHLHALEVTDLEQKGRRTTASFFNGSKPEYPRRMHCIQGSDAHRLARDPNNPKNLGIGDRATDVLLEEVNFDALKALFLGNDFARTRPHSAHGTAQAEFDYVQEAREQGASIVQDFHDAMTQRGGKLYAVISDVCGFANTNGGTLYIGAGRDPKHPPVGVSGAEQAIKELRAAIDRQLTPRLTCTIDTQTSRGKTIVRVQVPRGDDPPYALDENKIYVRQEAETSLAVRDEIVQLVLRRHTPPVSVPVAHPAPAAPAEKTAPAAPATRAQPSAPQKAPPAALAPGASANGHDFAPRTGVEIVATEARNGVRYHTMHDLRNNSFVKNVTRSSARKLWHYAIAEREAGLPKPDAVTWFGEVGLYKKREKGGVMRYDLVQRTAEGLRVFFGVTEDGIHGEWRKVVGQETLVPPAIPPGIPAPAGRVALLDVAAEFEAAPAPVAEPSAPETPIEAKPTRSRKPRAASAKAKAKAAPMLAEDIQPEPAPEPKPKPKKTRAAKAKAPATAANPVATPRGKPKTPRAKKPKAPAVE